MIEQPIDFEQLQFQGKVADLLEAVGFDRSEQEAWRRTSVDGVIRQLKEWDIVNYERGLKYTPWIFDKHLALLMVPPLRTGTVVCLYGEREVAIAGAFISGEGDQESQIEPQSARIDHIRLFPRGLYKVGHITAGRFHTGATFGGAFNDPRFRRLPRQIQDPSLEQQIMAWMRDERNSIINGTL
jgi:hypothetical protein